MTGTETGPSPDWRVAVLVAAPATLLVALAAHPFIEGRLPNQTAIAEHVVAGTTRWGVVHLAAALASALIAVAFLAIEQYLHQAGAIRASKIGGARIPQVVSVALVVMAVSRIIPLSVTQFYAHGLAAVLVMWPLAHALRTNRKPSGVASAAMVG